MALKDMAKKISRMAPVLMEAACPISVGGQAVIEGVMMRSPKSFVVAVRRPDGQIVVREQDWETLFSGVKFLRLPFFRGAIVLIESLWNGMSALNFSAEQAMVGEADGQEKGKGADDGKGEDPAKGNPEKKAEGECGGKDGGNAPHDVASYGGSAPHQASAGEKAAMAVTMATSLALGMGLFVALPHILTWLLGEGTGLNLPTNGAAFHLIDGIFKAAIFVVYLLGISQMQDIRRVFQYHGAEHKSIWAFESQAELVPESAAKFTTLHPRCGTAFILIVLLVSIVLFAGVFPFVPVLSDNKILNQLGLICVKLPLMFPVAGIAYELQRLSARKNCPSVIKGLLKPGLWMQRITTNEPDASQLEVALVSLRRALGRENGILKGPPEVRLYRDFQEAVAFEKAASSEKREAEKDSGNSAPSSSSAVQDEKAVESNGKDARDSEPAGSVSPAGREAA